MHNSSSPSPDLLLEQRVRNRVIESLELAASFDEQLAYQANVPIAQVPAEVINGWDDWVNERTLREWFGPPVYSPEESAAIHRFHAVMEGVCQDTPRDLPALDELFGTEPWRRLRDAAAEALAVFRVRGRFSEEMVESQFVSG